LLLTDILLSLLHSIDFLLFMLTKEFADDSAGAGGSKWMFLKFGHKGHQDRVRVRKQSLEAALDAEILAVQTGNVLRKIPTAARHVAETKTP
jgi:hypothetical protein